MKSCNCLTGWYHTHTYTHNHFTALWILSGSTQVSQYQKGKKPIWILLQQETVSGSGNSWAICKSAPHPRQITMPAPHHSILYRLNTLPTAKPTVSKHWRHNTAYLLT